LAAGACRWRIARGRQVAAEELADEETWIKGGNMRGSKGGNGTAVEAVRSAFAQEPGGIGAPNGLTGILNLTGRGIRALPPQLFTQTKLTQLWLGGNPELCGDILPEIGALTELIELKLSATAVTALPVEAANLTALQRLDWREPKAPNATVRIPAVVFSTLPLRCTTNFRNARIAITGARGGFDVVLPAVLTNKGGFLKNNEVREFLAASRTSKVAARPRWLRSMVVGMADAGKTTVVGKMAGTRGTLGTLKASALGKINRRAVTFGVDVVT
jgi:hypothetical protein